LEQSLKVAEIPSFHSVVTGDGRMGKWEKKVGVADGFTSPQRV